MSTISSIFSYRLFSNWKIFEIFAINEIQLKIDLVTFIGAYFFSSNFLLFRTYSMNLRQYHRNSIPSEEKKPLNVNLAYILYTLFLFIFNSLCAFFSGERVICIDDITFAIHLYHIERKRALKACEATHCLNKYIIVCVCAWKHA